MTRYRGLYVLDPHAFGMIYGPDEQRDIAAMVDIMAAPLSASGVLARADLLAKADVIFSGWQGPMLDEAFFAVATKLKAVFYGAGAMGYILTPAVWERGIVVTSALEANAVPVAEYTLAAILLSLKHGWRLARQTRVQRNFPERNQVPGCYGSTAGLISLGTIGRKVLELLQGFELRVLVYDPFLRETDAELLGMEQVSLDELFGRSDVISLHTPVFPETIGMITGTHIASMQHGAIHKHRPWRIDPRAGDDRCARATAGFASGAGCDHRGTAASGFAALRDGQRSADATHRRFGRP